MHRQDDHQHQKGGHKVFGDPLKPPLQVEAQDDEPDGHSDKQVDDVDGGVRDHGHKAQVRCTADQEHHKVVDHPTGDHGVEGHERHVPQQGEIAVDMPLLPGLFQLLIHPDGAGLGRTAHGELHDHRRQTQKHQAEDIHKDKSAAAVLPGHPREFPDIPAANGTAGAEHDKAQTASESFSSIVHRHDSSLYLIIRL